MCISVIVKNMFNPLYSGRAEALPNYIKRKTITN